MDGLSKRVPVGVAATRSLNDEVGIGGHKLLQSRTVECIDNTALAGVRRRPGGDAMTNDTAAQTRLALVTGATGYVGSNLVTELLDRGWRVRTLSRSRDKALSMPWGDKIVAEGKQAGAGEVEVYEGDATDRQDLGAALADATAAWYLIHSMGEGDDFRKQERETAQRFAAVAEEQEIGRIVFLGGLHPSDEELSEHLGSRVEVGEIFLDSKVPTAALQAGVVLGQGSISFQMLRHLSERLPGAIGPDWIRHEITPISVRDVVFYLASAAELPADVNRTFDIGGPDTLEYATMMKEYAKAEGLLPRLVFSAPVTTPELAARWIALVTPIKTGVAEPLIGSLLHNTVVKERDLEEMVGTPEGGNQSFAEAVAEANKGVDTRRWMKTLGLVGGAVTACGVIGSMLSKPDSRHYRSLKLPNWQPPAIAFPIVWIALYADIAAINSLVLADHIEEDTAKSKAAARKHAAALGANLALNAGWSGVFFRSKRKRLAAAWAGALAASSADLVRRAWKSAPERGALLAPYAAWTGFATVLSAEIARLNRKR